MNKKGFTLVELLAAIIILSIVTGIAAIAIVSSFKKAKEDTENVFIKNLEDAIEIYIDSIVVSGSINKNVKSLDFDTSASAVVCSINKRFDTSKVHPADNTIKLSDLADPTKNEYSPLGEVVNPANEKAECKPENTTIKLYRDDDYVYYYFIEKQNLDCLLDKTGYITNLPCECINRKIVSNPDKTLLSRCR